MITLYHHGSSVCAGKVRLVLAEKSVPWDGVYIDILRGDQFDLIVNTVSADVDWNQYFKLLKLDGTMVMVGLPEIKMTVDPFALIGRRRSLAGSMIGGIQETQEMLDFCGKHKLGCDIEMTPIQKINEAYERVINSDVRYRFVIDLASLRNS